MSGQVMNSDELQFCDFFYFICLWPSAGVDRDLCGSDEWFWWSFELSPSTNITVLCLYKYFKISWMVHRSIFWTCFITSVSAGANPSAHQAGKSQGIHRPFTLTFTTTVNKTQHDHKYEKTLFIFEGKLFWMLTKGNHIQTVLYNTQNTLI